MDTYYNLKKYSELDLSDNTQKIGLFINYQASSHIRILSNLCLLNNQEYTPYIINMSEQDKCRKDLENDLFFLDIVIVERNVLDDDFTNLLIEKCKLLDIKLIYELDDDLINIDLSHPQYEKYSKASKTIVRIAENADELVVSTNYLKDKLSIYNDNITVIPNTLTEAWDKETTFQPKDSNLIKIGYMGTTTHKNDLKLVEEAIINVKEYFKNSNQEVVFEIIGGSDEDLKYAQEISIPQEKRDYPNFVKWLKETVNWDLALAPIEDTPINNSKSELKYLEYTALNVPCIFSNLGPYKENIQDGITGLLAENNTKDWEEKIIKLIEDVNLRKNILTNAKRDVRENYLLNTSVVLWENILYKSKRNKNSILYKKVKEYNNFPFFSKDNQPGISFKKFLESESYNIIKMSDLFDEQWYLNEYPDVEAAKLDPIQHYLDFAVMELTNPNENFNTKDYLKTHSKIGELDFNPLVYNILYYEQMDTQIDYIYSEYYSNLDSRLKIIEKSGLFDEKYYLSQYKDIRESVWASNPIIHWIEEGYLEPFRNPNRYFSNLFYNERYLSNKDYPSDALLHYATIGKENNYKRNIWDLSYKDYNHETVKSIMNHLDKKLSIIVLSFNHIVTQKCIDLVRKYTNLNYELIVIDDDCDDDWSYYLKDKTDIKVINNSNKNLLKLLQETVKTISNDLVILNSYAEVTPNWLNNIIIKAYSNNTISMVSPLSNAVNNLSPERYENETEYLLTNEGFSNVIKKSSEDLNIVNTISNGYCLFIKEKYLNWLDLDNINLYYDIDKKILGFELLNNKLNHVICDSSYVYNNYDFIEDNLDLLKQYNSNSNTFSIIDEYLNSDEIKILNKNIDVAIKEFNNLTISNRVLYVLKEDNIKLALDFYTIHNKSILDSYYLVYLDGQLALKDRYNSTLKHWKLDISNDTEKLEDIFFNLISSLNIDVIQVYDVIDNINILAKVSNTLTTPMVINSDIDSIKSYDNVHLSNIDLLNFKDLSSQSIETHIKKPVKFLIIGNRDNDTNNYLKAILKKDVDNLFDFHYIDESSLNTINNAVQEIQPEFIGFFSEFIEIFDVIDELEKYKIPFITYNQNTLIGQLLEDTPGVLYLSMDSSKAFNQIMNNLTSNGYYYLKQKFFRNTDIDNDVIRYNQECKELYFKLGDNSPKIKAKEDFIKPREDNREKPVFSDFSGFLADAYVSPVIRAPFFEEEKRCFAFMDEIAKYLSQNVDNLKDKPLVSVIMPAYNREKIIDKAINSVLNQSYTNFELIIVDDKSTDRTREVLKTFAESDDRIHLINHDINKGASATRNTALKIAKGEYIFYLDSDNEWDSRYLKAMMGAFLELPQADAVYSGQLLYRDFNSQPFAMRFGTYNKSLLHNGNYIDINCFAHKKDVIETVGYFDESLKRLVDWDYILKISNDCQIYSIPILLSKYYFDNADNRISEISLRNTENKESNTHYNKLIQDKNKMKCRVNDELTHKVTIVIPNYQALDDLRDCIKSIQSLNLGDKLKIVIVDNNSNEAVRYYLKLLESQNIIELIQLDINYGFTHAVNIGINHADSDSDILLLNNDTNLTKGSVEAMQKYAYEISDCGLIVPQQILPGKTESMNTHVPYATPFFDCDVNPSRHHKNIHNMSVFHDGNVLELSFAPFFCVYIKREVLDNSLGLDAELGRHYRSDRIFSNYIRHIMNLKLYHVSDSIVYHKLQKSTKKLRQKKGIKSLNIMLYKNQWEPELAEELGFKKALWDD